MAATAPPEPHEQDRVDSWRLYQLLKLGVPREEAENLARRPDVDWHQLARLIRAGCPTDTALRIIA